MASRRYRYPSKETDMNTLTEAMKKVGEQDPFSPLTANYGSSTTQALGLDDMINNIEQSKDSLCSSVTTSFESTKAILESRIDQYDKYRIRVDTLLSDARKALRAIEAAITDVHEDPDYVTVPDLKANKKKLLDENKDFTAKPMGDQFTTPFTSDKE